VYNGIKGGDISLPGGLSVNTATGVLSGTPTAAGSYAIALYAHNASGTGWEVLTLTVLPSSSVTPITASATTAPGAPVITSPTMATATVNQPFTYQITATNNPTSYNALASWLPVAYYQRDLYSQAKASATLQNYPVFGSSEDGAEQDNVGLQYLTIPPGAPDGALLPAGTPYADFANPHDYLDKYSSIIDNLSWRAADPLQDGAFDGLYSEYGVTWWQNFPGYSSTTNPTLSNLPRVTTETGWPSTGAGHSEDQQGKVYLNTYLDFFKRGWNDTFIYEMVDDQGGGSGGQALYNPNGTPKLAATYIHNLTTLLADNTSNAPGSVNYSIPGEPATVHDLLLQKSDGSFDLVVWDERATGTDNVTVNLGAAYSSVAVYDPTIGTSVQQQLSNVNQVSLSLGDHPLIVQIGAATHFGITTPASSTTGSAFSISVSALDASNNIVPGYTGTVHFTLTGPVSATANYTFTSSDMGQHTFGNLVLRRAGAYTLAGADTVNPLITGSTTFTITPAAPDHIAFTIPGTVTVSVPFAITVTVQDAYGNTVTGYLGTVHFTLTGPEMAQADYTFPASDMGSHTFSNRVLNQTGMYTLTGTDMADPTLTGTGMFTVM
jgi:hypothetical protein